MKKKILLFALSLIFAGLAWGQGLETFDNMPETGGSYGDGTFTGQDGSTWTYVQCRSDYDITGNSCMLGRNRTPQSNVYSGMISGGIGTLSFNYMQAFSTDVNLNVLVNDQVVGNVTSTSQQGVILNSGDITVNVAGNFVIKFINVNNSDGQVCIDDITWTAYSTGGNIPPAITGIVHTPSTDILSTTTVSVSANVTDSDGTVALVQLKWGTQTGVYPNTINMSQGTGDTYTTDSSIPAQIDETTVYYVVFAMDDDSDTTTSGEQSYTVRDPVYTALPYGETFDADLGDCYVYSVSGDSKHWTWSTYQCAYMNGYNSGDTEEDWLILPGINLNNYSDVTMSFDTWYNYGTDDVNNYLKLMYSTDYAGYGDPTLATWAELPFTHPTASQTWTSSGIIDLSGISGTSVWIGYKYRYEAGNYRGWEVDNVSILEGAAIFASVSSLDGFTYELGNGPSAEQTFTVSGTGLTDDIVLTAPTDYEISVASGTGFTSSITLTQTGGSVAETTIYVRLEAGLPVGTYNGELINITSTGATGLTVSCSGEVTSPPPPEAPVATDATNVTSSGFSANWNASTGATGYNLDVYTIEPAVTTDLFFSEYIEGGSSNKALEIYNGTGSDVDLSDYTVELYSNGATTPGNTLELTGTLANGEVYVIANSSAAVDILNVADITSTVTSFNGNDALAILKESSASHVDIFGCIGEDPGSEWASGDHSTLNMTLVRKSSVTGGVTTNPATGFPTLETEWDAYPQDTFGYLDSHNAMAITYVTGYEDLDTGNVTTYPVTGLAAGTTYNYVVRAYNTYDTSGDSNEISVTTTGGAIPEISVTGEPVFLYNIAGVPSDEITEYQLSGTNLSAPIDIVAPTHFEISTTGTEGWEGTLQVPYDFSGTIYVRLNSSEVGTHGGDITHNSTGATQATIFVEGETLAPVVTWNIAESLTDFAQELGTPSDAQSYTLSPTGAIADITVSVDSPFELSVTGSSSWQTSLTLAMDFSGLLYVRLNSAITGEFTGTIEHTTYGATPEYIELTGTTSPPAGSYATDLFFSEYIEGSSSNKALEIFNGTGMPVDLSNYRVELYSNGSSTAGNTLTMTGTLAHGEVYVIANSGAVQAILDEADVTSSVTFFNGNDALALLKISPDTTYVDIFGVIGDDPVTAWVSGDHSTGEHTLVRKPTIVEGVTENPTGTGTGAFVTLETEWDVYPQNTVDYLGAHTFSPDTPVAETPVLDPPGGVYFSTVNVTMSTTTPSATIYYTDDGSTPSDTNGFVYTGAVAVSTSTTLKAIAYAPGYTASGVASETYVFPVVVNDIAELRAQTIDNETIYMLSGEAILTFQQPTRNQKFIQDATAAIVIDDDSSIITTTYNLYDGITGITGTLGTYAELLQFTPVTDPGPATSTGNTVVPEVRTLASLTPADQAKLIKVMNVTLDSTSGNFASYAQNIDATDPTATLTLRTFPNTDYSGTPIPVDPVNITCLVGQYNTGMQISPRFLADFEPYGVTLDSPVVSVMETGGTIWLNWNDVDGATSYRVEHSDDPYTGYTVLGTTNNIEYSTPANGKKFFRVIAVQ